MRHTLIRGTNQNQRRLLRCGFVGLLALVVLFVPAQAARSDSPPQCAVSYGPSGGPPGLGVAAFSILNYDVPQGSNSVSGSATLPLYPSWNLLFSNGSATTVTDPTITVSSGLAGLPSSCSQPSLDPGGTLNLGFVAPESIHGGNLGYDSSAVAVPSVLPPAGGEVTVSFTVTLTGSAFAGGDIDVSIGNGDVNVLSQGIPQNLDQGETVSADGNGEWYLAHAQLGKPYVFTALVEVGAAGPAPAPYVFSPPAFIRVDGGCALCGAQTTGSSVTVADTNLDGAFTFSVDQPGQSWNVFHANLFETNYSEQTPPLTAAQCKKGGWQAYGVFKNQGDCVSYVATRGKNPPNG
jgi:hypothetical protein